MISSGKIAQLNILVDNVTSTIAISECSGSPILSEKNCNISNAIEDNENWRFPNLSEVVADLRSCDDEVKLNAAAYLQHLSYRNDSVKSLARELKAFAPLIEMLLHSNHEVVRSALGALRNLSCGKANDFNKVEIMRNDGVRILVEVIKTSHSHSVIEVASGLLWNLSSCPALKDEIIQRSLDVLFNFIIMPLLCCISTDTSQPPHKLSFSNFRHATGVLRNVSSSGGESRAELHRHGSLADSLLSFVSWSSKHRDVDEKSIENCLCIIKNLSCNLEDYYFDGPSRSRSLGRRSDRKKSILDSPSASCFRSKRSSKYQKQLIKFSSTGEGLVPENSAQMLKLMLRPDVIAVMIHLLQTHKNNVDICEATLGIIQNICFPFSQPPLGILESLRKCQGLPVIVQNLTMLSDKVVLAASVVLKILITDHVNQNIIGGVIMDHLLSRPLPNKDECPYSADIQNFLSSAIFECIGSNVAFARNVLITGGIKQLTNIVLSPTSFGIRASQLAAIVLKKLWSFQELHEEMKVRGLRKSDFMVEPPKKTSMESLDSCVVELEGRSKKVRFVEAPLSEEPSGCHKPLPTEVIPMPKTPDHTATKIQKSPRRTPDTCHLFVSNTLPKPGYSLSSVKSQHLFPFRALPSSSSLCISQRQNNANIFFPCCYPSLPTTMGLRQTVLPTFPEARRSADSTMPINAIVVSSAVFSLSSSSSSSPMVSIPMQVTAQPNKIFIPSNSWV